MSYNLKERYPMKVVAKILTTLVLALGLWTAVARAQTEPTPYQAQLVAEIDTLVLGSTQWVALPGDSAYIHPPILETEMALWVPLALGADFLTGTYQLTVNIFDCSDNTFAIAAEAVVSAESREVLEGRVARGDQLIWHKLSPGTLGWDILAQVCTSY
jgi:hypothetical protein